jgi:hypothetical protein
MSCSNAFRCAAGLAAVLLTAQGFAAGEAGAGAAAASAAKDEDLVCRYELRPGSHMREHLCATKGQWAEIRARDTATMNAASGNASLGPSGPVAPTVSVIMNR